MTDKARIKLAALVTAVFLAAISTAGLATHSGKVAGAAAPATAAAVEQSTAPAPAQRSAIRFADDYESEAYDHDEND